MANLKLFQRIECPDYAQKLQIFYTAHYFVDVNRKQVNQVLDPRPRGIQMTKPFILSDYIDHIWRELPDS